jgi:CBS domain-containing protein
VYVAVGDTFCLRTDRDRFQELAHRSQVFLDFCRRRLGALLDLSRQELQARYANETSVERTMGTALGELARRPALTCGPDEPLRQVFQRMHALNVGSIVVVERNDRGEQPVGILTRTDLIGRVILPGVTLDTPVAAVMTRGVSALDAAATAADASLLMAQHGIRHVPVMERTGAIERVIGVVSERDLFTLQRLSVARITEALARSGNAAALAAAAADVRRLSHHLVAQGVAAEQMTRLISHLNDRLTQRLLQIEARRLAVPASGWCWLALGSEGRGEQTIATDQDNGLIHSEAIGRDAMLRFADAVNQGLALAGFPLCKGGIMASNPQWCGTLAHWSRLFADWIDRGDPESLLNGSIFFDFRGLHGDAALATQLRAEVTARAHQSSRFLKQMADNALRNRAPATGWFDELLRGGDDAPIDLKMHGTVPFVDAARIWALAAGCTATGTVDRFRQLAGEGTLPREDVEGWIDAFQFMQLMRLRRQHRLMETGGDAAAAPNTVRPRELSALDRRILREAFRQARKLQARLELDFPG